MKNSNKPHQDFYDENDEADEMEKIMANSWMSFFCGVVIVVLAIVASYAAVILVDYLATICNCN